MIENYLRNFQALLVFAPDILLAFFRKIKTFLRYKYYVMVTSSLLFTEYFEHLPTVHRSIFGYKKQRMEQYFK